MPAGRPSLYKPEYCEEVIELGKAPRGFSYIYTLNCPETDVVMYVGKTVSPVNRYRSHCKEFRGFTAKDKWCAKLAASGLIPKMKIIELTDDWRSAEKWWVGHYRSFGKLLNHSDGGDGGYKATGSKRQRSNYQTVINRLNAIIADGGCKLTQLRDNVREAKKHFAAQGEAHFFEYCMGRVFEDAK